jgi:hypothetical protein
MKTSFEQSMETFLYRLKNMFCGKKYAYLASSEDPDRDYVDVKKTWDVCLFAPSPIVYDWEESAKDAKKRIEAEAAAKALKKTDG